MRLGVVAPEFPPDRGGVERYSFEVVKLLGERGASVELFVPRSHIDSSMPSLANTIVRCALTFDIDQDRELLSSASVDKWLVLTAAYAWIANYFENVTVVVHGNDFLRCYSPVGRVSVAGIPFLWRLKDRPTRLFRYLTDLNKMRLVDSGLRDARAIVANSAYTASVLHSKFPATEFKTTVGSVGLSRDFLNGYRRKRKETVEPSRFLTVARLDEPRKNVQVVLEALHHLRSFREFCYHIVGEGKIRAELEYMAVDLGLESQVRFLGAISDSDLYEEYSRADLFILTSAILPYSHEGFGMAYLEANAFGTPVLAARQAGAIEAVDDGVSGYFVDVPSAEQVKQALETFLAGRIVFDPELCRAHAASFTWDKVVDVIYKAMDV